MFKLDAGNVLLKPSHRRQLMGWLKRALRLGQRLGNLAITISMERVGRFFEIKADVRDGRHTAAFRSRQHSWQDAAREMVRALTAYIHDLTVRRLLA